MINKEKTVFKKQQPIGGYFSLELPFFDEYHENAIKLNTGRNCLEYILCSRRYKRVYIPYYTCEVILEPFKKTGTEYSFYHINLNFEIADDIYLREDEALLYVNYYGLKQRYVEFLSSQYGQQLIIDNTQAFYAKPIAGIDTFYTCRKFFGVPDGAYLYTDKVLDIELDKDISFERMSFLLKRIDLGPEAGYRDFREQSHLLVGQAIKVMSQLTKRLMQSIDYDAIAQKRRRNFLQLHDELKARNQLQIQLEDDAIPMIYPYLTEKSGLRNHLIQNKVFVAQYWPNVLEWCNEDESIELCLTMQLMALPIDQRYGEYDMKRIVDTILLTENEFKR